MKFEIALLLVLLIFFLIKIIRGSSIELFGGKNLEVAIVPPLFNSDPLDPYIEPLVWENPSLMNANRPWPEFTRNF